MDFRPSTKHIIVDRKWYNELTTDLQKIKLAITAQEARGMAGAILDKLKAKFDSDPQMEQKIRGAITQMDASLGISHQHEGKEVDVNPSARPGFLNKTR